ncbi:MAG: hypothetical protein KOO69_08130 [Victivallales bacterium]|nr:hypothetical protein [Victivallales bacterium]
MKKILFLICSSSAILFMAACSTCKPVLYSNNHYKRVGSKQAERDIQTAIKMAKTQGLDDSSASNRTLAKSASRSAANTGVSTALGSASVAGATGSGLSFLIDWMFTSKAPKPLFKKHVELTLRQQGYQVLGWK